MSERFNHSMMAPFFVLLSYSFSAYIEKLSCKSSIGYRKEHYYVMA